MSDKTKLAIERGFPYLPSSLELSEYLYAYNFFSTIFYYFAYFFFMAFFFLGLAAFSSIGIDSFKTTGGAPFEEDEPKNALIPSNKDFFYFFSGALIISYSTTPLSS